MLIWLLNKTNRHMAPLNFKKIKLWQMSHANDNTKISSEETLVAKELVLLILHIALALTQPKIYVNFKNYGCIKSVMIMSIQISRRSI